MVFHFVLTQIAAITNKINSPWDLGTWSRSGSQIEILLSSVQQSKLDIILILQGIINILWENSATEENLRCVIC